MLSSNGCRLSNQAKSPNPPGDPAWVLRFQDGTLLVEGAPLEALPEGFVFDDRVGCPRGPGWQYAPLVRQMVAAGQPFADQARSWEPLARRPLTPRRPRDYQREALAAWEGAQRRGAVLLPTGSGKSFVAEMAIARTRRPALVVAPTLDLVGQWHDRLAAAFGVEVGILGGGHHELRDITVTTYDSAWRHLPTYGDRFGLLVFDEVHHLPAPGYLAAAEGAMAPFRLGLTATWERADGREDFLDDALGPVVYRREITDLAGEFLSSYEVIHLTVHLSPSEQARYDAARRTYTSFIGRKRIPIGAPGGWQAFLRIAARSREGREAFMAYRESKRISHGSEQKLALLATILEEQWGRPTIVFTNDNATAYRISRSLLVPCISHQTDIKERRSLLERFEARQIPVLVTSRVLNEGVDLPAAEVAVVLSGSGTVREHVQRLGRVLRPGEGKHAVLYEVVAAGTSEVGTSERRRQHRAYE